MTRLIQLGEARMGADPGQTEKLIDSFLDHFRHRRVLPSIQMMRQAMKLSTSKETIAHFASSWTVPIVNWNRPFRENSALIKEVYLSGAGSGFILDTADDPVGTAKLINDLLAGTEAPVRMGGGAQLSVRHPRIREFIECKAAGLELPYLGTSVRLTQGFVNKLSIGEGRDIWHRLIESAWRCGDPGILMPYEFPNGTPEIGDPRTAATCADVSLYPNERCVFLNVNVAAFLRPGDRSMDEYDYRRLYDAVRTMARVGDAALELGLSPGDKANHEINYLRRKLSIAPLGVSDLAWRLGLPYGSAAFTNMLSVVLGVFDHAVLSAGADLAAERGAFPLYRSGLVTAERVLQSVMDRNLCDGLTLLPIVQGPRQNNLGPLLSSLGLNGPSVIPWEAWVELGWRIRDHGTRFAESASVPPTGGVAAALSASSSIAAPVSLLQNGQVNPIFAEALWRHLSHQGQPTGAFEKLYRGIIEGVALTGSCQGYQALSREFREVFRTATELPVSQQLAIARQARFAIHGGVSLTIGLPWSAGLKDVHEAFWGALRCLTGATVYRNPVMPDDIFGP